MISMPDGTTITVRKYLLGTLSEPDAQAVEERYLSQPEWLDTIAAEEEALIEAFLDARLDQSERLAFERFYLASPVHRNRVALVAALRKRAAQTASLAPTPAKAIARPWFRHPLVRLATAAVLVLGIVTLMRLLSRPVDVLQVSIAPSPTPTPPDEALPVPSPSSSTDRPAEAAPVPPPPPIVFAVTLPSLTTRGAGQPTVTIPKTADRVAIRLQGEPPPSARALTATIRTVDGREIWAGPATRGRAGIMAAIDVPAALLPAEDYLLSVSDGDELGTFAFRVARR
jgi:hypothetical protein